MERVGAKDREALVVGADIGGTFTDLVAVEEGRIRLHKLLSTPPDPALAFLQGLEEAGFDGASRMVHGSTVAVNALLERKGARTAFLATRGFSDLLHLGRQTRPSLYDLWVERPSPLVPRELCFGVTERVGPRGEVVAPLDEEEAERLADRLRDLGVETAAVCFLFSFLRPEHEEAVGRILRERGIRAYLSCRVLPEYREYERASTVTINAYVGPVVDGYVARLEERLGAGRLEMMHSGGGTLSPAEVRSVPARIIMSGPAGGVVAAWKVARAAGFPRAISLDMGGTSTDVALIDGELPVTPEGTVAGFPLRFPTVDVHSIGSGGGSIAWVDAGGVLKVGPRSAGAQPGPACYGRGSEPTVTDAHLVLGRLPGYGLLGGRMPLDGDRSKEALLKLGRRLGWGAQEVARGILMVVLSQMARAVRAISVERGHDPARFVLVAFGGAGPMLGCELAELLGMAKVLVPPCPGAFSALGMVLSDRVWDGTRALMMELGGEAVRAAARAWQEMRSCLPPEWRVGKAKTAADLRYRGQGYELTVPVDPSWGPGEWKEAFHRAHLKRFGYALEDEIIEIANLRLRMTLPAPLEAEGLSLLAEVPGNDLREPALGGGSGEVHFLRRGREWWVGSCPVLQRSRLERGRRGKGPALVLEEDATILVPPGWSFRVDSLGNLVMEKVGTR
jgi:N-methylhydantoinase A